MRLKARQIDSSYQQEQLDNGRVRFTVTAASVPKSTFGPRGVGICVGVFTFFCLNHSMGRNAVIAGAVAYVVTRYLLDRLWDLDVNSSRTRGGAFVVSATGLDLPKGGAIATGQITRLILRNSARKGSNEVYVYDARSAVQQLGAAAQQAKAVNRGLAASVSYNLCVESGGKSTVLAGGMTEVTACGLLSDTAKVLGLAVR